MNLFLILGILTATAIVLVIILGPKKSQTMPIMPTTPPLKKTTVRHHKKRRKPRRKNKKKTKKPELDIVQEQSNEKYGQFESNGQSLFGLQGTSGAPPMKTTFTSLE